MHLVQCFYFEILVPIFASIIFIKIDLNLYKWPEEKFKIIWVFHFDLTFDFKGPILVPHLTSKSAASCFYLPFVVGHRGEAVNNTYYIPVVGAFI